MSPAGAPAPARTINADYSHRFSADFIRQSYPSLDDAFEQGNFVLVADQAPNGSELQGMAFILAGIPEKGIRVLSERDDLSERAKIVLAFGYWFLDRPQSALSILGDCSREGAFASLAAELQRLINARRIPILQIVLPPPRDGDADFADPLWSSRQTVGQFEICNVATQAPRDCSVEDDFAAYVAALPKEEKPAFVLALMTHWFFPRNIEKSGLPLVMWTHDQDHFVHRNYDNYRLCDLNIVTTSQEHFEMARGCGMFSVSNMLTDPFATSYERPVAKPTPKDIDLLFTSTGFDFFLSDKSRFLFNLSRLSEEFNLRYVDGRLPYGEYMDMNSRARFVPVVSRVCGNPSPRWREALASSSFLLYPAQTMFGRVTAGCYAYGEATYVEDIRRHFDAARTNAGERYDHDAVLAQVAKDFDSHRTTRELQRERFLRLASFMLAMKKTMRWQPKTPPEPAPRRRFVWLSAPVTVHYFRPLNVLTKVLQAADRVAPAPDWRDIDYNDLALTLHTCALMMRNQGIDGRHAWAKPEPLIERAEEILRQGLARFPRSLLLRFNAAQWPIVEDAVFNRPLRKGVAAAFQKLIDDFAGSEFDPLNADVANQHFYMFDGVFPHFSYGQLAVRYAVARRHPELIPLGSLPDPRLALLGAAHGYLGFVYYADGKDEQAIDRFDVALGYFQDNQPLCDLRFKALKRLSTQGTTGANVDNRLIDGFFAIADLYPVILLKEIQTVLPAMRRRGRTDEMRLLLRDWYRYAKTLDERSLKSYLSAEAITIILAHQAYFPEALMHACRTRQPFGSVPLSPLEALLADTYSGKSSAASLAALAPEPAPFWSVSTDSPALAAPRAMPTGFFARVVFRSYRYVKERPIYRRIYHRLLSERIRYTIRWKILAPIRDGLTAPSGTWEWKLRSIAQKTTSRLTFTRRPTARELLLGEQNSDLMNKKATLEQMNLALAEESKNLRRDVDALKAETGALTSERDGVRQLADDLATERDALLRSLRLITETFRATQLVETTAAVDIQRQEGIGTLAEDVIALKQSSIALIAERDLLAQQVTGLSDETTALKNNLAAAQTEQTRQLAEIDLLKNGGGPDFRTLEQTRPLSPAAAYRFDELVKLAQDGQPASSAPPLVFLHVPKTGGVFLDNILARNFRKRIDSYADNFFLKLYPQEFYSYLQPPGRDDTNRPVFFTGHIGLDNEIFHRIRGHHLSISLLREPVDRFVSHYTFHKGLPNNVLYDAIHRDRLSVVDYFERFPSLGVQSHTFIYPDERTAADPVGAGVRNLETKLSLFGLQERMDEFLILLSYLLGLPNLHYRKRLNASDRVDSEITETQRQKLAALMPQEVEFYRRAKALYLERLTQLPALVRALAAQADELRRHGRDIGAELEKLRPQHHPWSDAFT